ncbi:MAG: class II D-tagatose-bisphosphate aldolase, non-catalytic subunit [Candidatus Aenigmatarchaeota archaeon]
MLFLKNKISGLLKNLDNATLLAICPMSEIIVKATFEEAKESGFPILFVATRNQVDINGGYTGWDQQGLVNFVNRIAKESSFNGLVFIARDHGGPWFNFAERDLQESDAMEKTKKSFEKDIDNGFQMLHVDATMNSDSIDVVLKRTIELINHIEAYSKEKNFTMEYEVGTEEIEGGLTDLNVFENYLKELSKNPAWKKFCFVVAQTGTKLGFKGEHNFDEKRAKELVEIAKRYGLGIKQHSTDDMETSQLRLFPKIGVAAANVGPEFSVAETQTYVDDEPALLEAFKTAALRDGKWHKWSKKQESELTEKEKIELAVSCARYVYNYPEIKNAMSRMNKRVCADALDAVKASIHRYVDAFNLAGTI